MTEAQAEAIIEQLKAIAAAIQRQTNAIEGLDATILTK